MTRPVAARMTATEHRTIAIGLRGAVHVDVMLPVEEIETGGATISAKIETSLAGGVWTGTDVTFDGNSTLSSAGEHTARVALPEACDAARLVWSTSSGKATVGEAFLLPVFP